MDNDIERQFKPSDKEEWEQFVLEQAQENPLIRRMINKIPKSVAVRQLVSEDYEIALSIYHVVIRSSLVPKGEIDYYQENDEIFKMIYEKVKEDLENGTISRGLIHQYARNSRPVIKKAEKLLEQRKKRIYGDEYDSIIEVKESERENKEEIIENIKQPFKKNEDNSSDFRDIERLSSIRDKLKRFPYSEEKLRNEANEVESVNGDEMYLQKSYAVEILEPEKFTTIHKYEEKYEQSPLTWINDIELFRDRLVYQIYKNSRSDQEIASKLLEDEDYLDDLLDEAIDIPFFNDREDILSEIIVNHKDGRYASSINLILPQIESFIWIYAVFLDKMGLETIFESDIKSNIWEFNRRDYNDLAVLSLNNNVIEDPGVKDLMENTALSNQLTKNTIDHFISELFEERNPILHGNIIDYDTEENSARKIIFLKNLIDKFVGQAIDPSLYGDVSQIDIDVNWQDILSQPNTNNN